MQVNLLRTPDPEVSASRLYGGGVGDAENLNGSVNAIASGMPRAKRIRCIFGLLCTFIGLLALSLLGLLYFTGYFELVDHNVVIDGDFAVEPNTKEKFPLIIIDSLTGRKMHIAGLFLKVQKAAGMTFKVFTLAFYLDMEIAKKVLAKYKDTPNDNNGEPIDPELEKILTDGVSIPGKLKYRMTLSIPQYRMYDDWFGRMKETMEHEHVAEEIIKSSEAAFRKWIRRTLNENDRLEFDWQSATPGNTKNKILQLSFSYQNVPIPPIEVHQELIHSVIRHEFLDNGNYVTNLLHTIWQTAEKEQEKGQYIM